MNGGDGEHRAIERLESGLLGRTIATRRGEQRLQERAEVLVGAQLPSDDGGGVRPPQRPVPRFLDAGDGAALELIDDETGRVERQIADHRRHMRSTFLANTRLNEEFFRRFRESAGQ